MDESIRKPAGTDDPPLTIADKVNLLFQYLRRDDGREHPNSAIQPAVNATTVWKIRQGLTGSPGHKVVQAICDFFQVPLAYLDCKTRRQCLEFLASQPALRMRVLSGMALRAQSDDSESDVEILETMDELIQFVKAQRRPRADS